MNCAVLQIHRAESFSPPLTASPFHVDRIVAWCKDVSYGDMNKRDNP
jgi:hypothetical protein